jgi:hypothetical protein
MAILSNEPRYLSIALTPGSRNHSPSVSRAFVPQRGENISQLIETVYWKIRAKIKKAPSNRSLF